MPAKVAASIFLEIVDATPATNPKYLGGISYIVALKTAKRHHIGTIHRIVMPDGSVPHEHGKDYTLRDCSRVRTGEV